MHTYVHICVCMYVCMFLSMYVYIISRVNNEDTSLSTPELKLALHDCQLMMKSENLVAGVKSSRFT